MRTSLKFAATIGMAFLSTAMVATANSFQCIVNDVVTFGDDVEFIDKNIKKKFLITSDDERVYVTAVSDDFANYQTIYTIVSRAGMDTFAVNLTSISMDTAAISGVYFEGVYDATLITQSALSATVWKLDCQKV